MIRLYKIYVWSIILKEKFGYDDDWGFFPVQFFPGRLAKFAGASSFDIEADSIRIINKSDDTIIHFADIEKIDVQKNSLFVICPDEKVKISPPRGQAELIKELVDRLLLEYVNYTEVLSTSANDFTWYDDFKKILTFRAKPFVWAVELLIRKAVEMNVADLHFEPFGSQAKLSFRIDDEIIQPGAVPSYYAERISSRLKYLAGCQSHVTNIPQEGAFKDEQTGMDIRLSIFPAENGERIAVRFINVIKYKTLESLNWSNEALTKWRSIINDTSGLFLITGPVGSGKTTAMYSTLSELAAANAKSRVVTIEDPVEGKIPEICQSSLEKMKGLSLAQAFKYILRQDPDIIALGEIRDKECLREALQASLSGHRVFATFHAGSSSEAILRIKQMGIDEYMVLSGIKAVLELKLERTGSATIPLVIVTRISNNP